MSELLVGRTDRVWTEEERDGETERKGGRWRCIQGLLGRWEFTFTPGSVRPGRGKTGGVRKKMFEEEKNCRRTDGHIKGQTDGPNIPVGDLFVPPPLTRQGVAFIPLPAAGVGVVGDAAARPPHPPETTDTSPFNGPVR